MVLGFGSSQTPWEKADVAIEGLLESARMFSNLHLQSCKLILYPGSLYAIVEPEPSQMGVIGAGKIGGRAEAVRQGINKSNKTLEACADAEPDLKMKPEQVASILERVEKNLSFLLDGLERISVLYYDRFVELGMGLTSIVSMALGWIEASSKVWLETIARVNKSEDLEGRIKSLSDTLLTAESKALDVYKGVKA